jgi:hypothetical protein
MKKKLKIDFLGSCQETEQLALIVTANNNGNNPVSLRDIASYLWTKRYLSYLKNHDLFGRFEDDEENKLYVMEDKKCVIVIEEVEIYELSANEKEAVI